MNYLTTRISYHFCDWMTSETTESTRKSKNTEKSDKMSKSSKFKLQPNFISIYGSIDETSFPARRSYSHQCLAPPIANAGGCGKVQSLPKEHSLTCQSSSSLNSGDGKWNKETLLTLVVWWWSNLIDTIAGSLLCYVSYLKHELFTSLIVYSTTNARCARMPNPAESDESKNWVHLMRLIHMATLSTMTMR